MNFAKMQYNLVSLSYNFSSFLKNKPKVPQNNIKRLGIFIPSLFHSLLFDVDCHDLKVVFSEHIQRFAGSPDVV